MIDAALLHAGPLVAATCAAIAVIALLRPLVLRFCGAAATLRLWWILPVVFVAAALPKRAVPVKFNVLPQVQDTVSPVVTSLAINAAPGMDIPWNFVVSIIWLAGTVLTAGWMLYVQRRYARKITWVRGRFGELPANSGPAVVGAIIPRLALPADFRARYSAIERRLILMHESIHLRRRDGLANLGMSILLTLQWFNPFVHWAARALCRDQESACDAAVVKRRPDALRTYADALLKTHPEMHYLPLVCRWHAYHPTVKRIAMLKHHRDMRIKTKLALALLLFGATSAGMLAYAARPTTLETTTIEAAAAPYQITVSLDTRKSDPSTPGQVSTTSRKFDVAARDGERFEVDLPGKMRVAMRANAEPSGKGIRVDTEIEDTVTQKIMQPTIIVRADEPASITVGGQDNQTTLELTVKSNPAAAGVTSALRAPTAWESEGITLNFSSIDLRALVQIISDFSRTKFSGQEMLPNSTISLKRRDVAAGSALRALLDCHGFALSESAGQYAIAPVGTAQPDPNACVETALSRLPEVTRTATTAVLSPATQCRIRAAADMKNLLAALPEGITKKSVNRRLDRIDFIGYAQSPARVSTLMRQIEESDSFEKPVTHEIVEATINDQRTNQFHLSFSPKCAKAVSST